VLRIYPDRLAPLLGYILADLGVILWIALCLFVGRVIYLAVMTLGIVGAGLIATGRRANDAITQVQQGISGLPLGIGDTLRNALTPLHGIPGGIVATGYNELRVVQHLSLVLSVVVAGLPLLGALLWYVPWRLRKTRGFRNLDRLLRRPGAGAAPATLQVLAGRAIYTLPYDRLLAYSPDPIGEWREGRYYNLARATMAAEGLDLRRYLRRVEGAPTSPPRVDELPVIEDTE